MNDHVGDQCKHPSKEVSDSHSFGTWSRSHIVAVSQTKHKQDCLILSHRNMHYNVANQPDAQKIFDEYDLQDSGLGQGKYGS